MNKTRSSPELRAILLAVEKSGPKAVSSLCVLSGVSEADFKAVLHDASGHRVAASQRQEIEARLSQALGLQRHSGGNQTPSGLARADWPDTPLKSLQILRGIQSIEHPVKQTPSQPNWPVFLALIAYLAISLTYALGPYGQF
ncbi:MAG: hypothetical protein ACO3QP_07050 [Burkholderiaceae bacterium]